MKTTTVVNETFEQRQDREAQERVEKYEQAEKIIQSVCEIMGFELDEREVDYWCFAREISKGDIKLFIRADSYGHKGKFEIIGSYPRDSKGQYINPYDYNESRADKINVSMTKTPEQVAKDIERRLMPEYLLRLAKIKKRIDESDNYHLSRQETIKQIAKATGFEISTHVEDGAIYFYDDGLSIDVKPRSGHKVDISIGGLSSEKAIQVLKLLK